MKVCYRQQWRSEGTLARGESPTKTAEFEAKNRRKSAKEAKAKHLLFVLLLFFEVIR